MKFKSLFDKLQTKPEPVRWLATLRNKNGVKMNLRRVDMGRGMDNITKPAGETIILSSSTVSHAKPPTSTPTLSNIKKLDPLITSGKIGSNNFDEELKIPPTSQWHQVKQDMKKDRSWVSMVMMVLAGCIFLGSGLYLYASNKIDSKDAIVAECKTYIENEKKKGFTSSTSSCDVNLQFYEYLFADSKAKTAFDKVKSSTEKQSKDQKSQGDDIDKQIKTIKQELIQFSPDFEKELAPTIKQPAETISEKQALLDGYKAIGKKYDDTVSSEQKKLKTTIEIAKNSVDASGQQTFVDSLASKSKGQIYALFPEITKQNEELKAKILEKNPASWFKSSLENPELLTYKSLTGDDIKTILETAVYKNTTSSQQAYQITGDAGADKKIIDIAEKRGYKKRPVADEKALVQNGNESQQVDAKAGYDALVDAAKADGIRIGLVSAYRSPEDQKGIFLSRLRSESLSSKGVVFTNADIAAGKADDVINTVLESSSISGYSRHHTGYAVDLSDLSSRKDFTQFADTEAFQWISSNNYFNAKRFGFLPSYPDGAKNQGPEPEAWEYTFVGVQVLKK
jgi:LAS superfamily LD-carboxypeptidase LdcB